VTDEERALRDHLRNGGHLDKDDVARLLDIARRRDCPCQTILDELIGTS
jgi:hypothetical protein